jgi:plastocyanin
MKLILLALLFSLPIQAEVRKITLVNYEIEGTKQWVPGTIAGYEEEELEITLINKAKGPHGFMIPSHDVTEVVKKGEKKIIKVKLKKEGIYPMKCHLHPAHIGGQLIILDK